MCFEEICCKFLAFLKKKRVKTLKMTISTSVWSAQHLNAGQNIQQRTKQGQPSFQFKICYSLQLYLCSFFLTFHKKQFECLFQQKLLSDLSYKINVRSEVKKSWRNQTFITDVSFKSVWHLDNFLCNVE